MYRALVLAQDTPPAPGGQDGSTTGDNGNSGGPSYLTWAPLILILVVMYFIMIRPQRKQQKQRQAMLSQMQKGDRVVTIGGFYGVIHQMKDDEIILKMDERNDVRMTVAKSAIARVVSEEDAPAKDKADA